jgi:large subunit ribosomal protein L36
MKVLSSLKSAKKRDKNCQLIKRKGRVYVINKLKPRLKAKQA